MRIDIKQGFIKYKMIGDSKHELFELKRIEIYPGYYRKGYATKLFKKMLNKIVFRKLFCTTHASNKVAHKFYEKMRMKMEAVLPNHYYKGESEIVYSLYSANPTNKNEGAKD